MWGIIEKTARGGMVFTAIMLIETSQGTVKSIGAAAGLVSILAALVLLVLAFWDT